ncbi:MAG: DUF4238 domain-containing protein [Rickettsiales bacterium]|nr:DUF4238 domain-containing protein [Rickettsiales bacterium]
MSLVKQRHHTVPAMHLKHFTGNQPNRKIWVYDKDSGKCFPKTPDDIGHQRYFYSVRKPDGSIDNTLEDFLSDIEGKSAPIYKNLLSGKFPQSVQERHDFATFLSLMYFRTPTMRRIVAEMRAAQLQIELYTHAKNDFDGLVKNVSDFKGKEYSEEQKQQLLQTITDPKDYEVEVPAELTLQALSAADSLTPVIQDMNWTLLYPKHGFLVTSDNPLFRAVDPRTVHPVMGDHGFNNKTAEVTFPLSPKAALLCTWTSLPRHIEMNRQWVNQLNEARVYAAERQIFSHLQHKAVSRLVESHSGSKVQYQTQGYGPKNYSKVRVKPPARDKQ